MFKDEYIIIFTTLKSILNILVLVQDNSTEVIFLFELMKYNRIEQNKNKNLLFKYFMMEWNELYIPCLTSQIGGK
jgi:hypothetical protein